MQKQSLNKRGEIDKEKLREGLNDIGATILTEGETTWLVEHKKTNIEIDIIEGDVKEHTGDISELPLKPSDDIANESTEFITDYGTIEVIWLKQTTNTVATEPNEPNLYSGSSALQPVTWTYNSANKTWTEDATAKSTWYNYAEGNGKADNLASMWANAKNTDGSYFVWIPRYAYRITYYSDADYNNVTGYYDGYGMWKAEDGSKKYDLDAGIETVEYNGKKYIVHPAFTSNVDNGGWGKNTSGFWVAKYEMSKTGASETSSGSGSTFYSLPSVQSARSINIGNMYTYSRAYDADKESHLIKNSEWGAVAYLTQSQYGRNGHEIDINNSRSYVTGNGGGAVGGSVSYVSGVTNYYNTETGAKASTTGNVYGIYDLSGGAWEYTASFNKLGNSSYVEGSSYGLNMTKEAKDEEGNYISTKYITAYSNGTNSGSGAVLYTTGKVGDATKEVRKMSSSFTAWFNDYSYVASSTVPFFLRGGNYSSDSYEGVFCSDGYNGDSGSASIRVVLGE